MSISTTSTTCPTCSGSGFRTQGTTTLLCITCRGGGGWLTTNDNRRLTVSWPLSAEPINSLATYLPYAFVSSGITAMVGASFAILQRYPVTLSGLIWHTGWPNALLGCGGLFLLYGLSQRQRQQRSLLSFDQLAEIPEQPLDSYINPRVTSLLAELAQTARQLNQSTVSETVLLYGLCKSPRIRSMLNRLELDNTNLLERLAGQLTAGISVPHPVIESAVRRRLLDACTIAIAYDYPYVDLEDIFLGFLARPGLYAPLFAAEDLQESRFRTVSDWYAADAARLQKWNFWRTKGHARPKGYMNRAWTALPTRMLDAFGSDLTQLAAKGQLPSVSVREVEIQQLLEVLGRTQHNSAVLVGEAGVGKTTVLGGVALRMLEGNVPSILLDKRLVLLEVSTLLSQAGEAEQNLEAILEEVEQAGNVILAIPDIHLLVGSSGAALDAATLLGSALARGTIQLISTARYADYHRYIESSPMLSNALDVIEIKEATVEQTILILESEIPHLEGQHDVTITYPALQAAAELAKRYLPEKVMPVSAINLLDETASAAQLNKLGWVTKSMVTARIAERTGVPIGETTAAQADHLLNLEEELHSRVIGQTLAVTAVSEAMRRAAAGLHRGNRPLASFLFVGPTGTGKTELAKALAELHFKRPDALLRFDMSEYQESSAAYALIGAPAASSDSFTEGGTLTQSVREHPYSLVLLDELEKAHPDVLNLLLQLLDDGRLTENTGRTVQFSNCVIIATSNAGTQELTTMLQENPSTEIAARQSLAILQHYFKPELINRFDRIVPFSPLTELEIEQIATMQLEVMRVDLATQRYDVQFAPDVAVMLAKIGFDPTFGARPLRRAVQDKVEGVLANLILTKQLVPGGMVTITAEMIQ